MKLTFMFMLFTLSQLALAQDSSSNTFVLSLENKKIVYHAKGYSDIFDARGLKYVNRMAYDLPYLKTEYFNKIIEVHLLIPPKDIADYKHHKRPKKLEVTINLPDTTDGFCNIYPGGGIQTRIINKRKRDYEKVLYWKCEEAGEKLVVKLKIHKFK